MEKLIIFIKLLPKLRRGIYVIGGMFIVAGHNVINPRYTFTNIMYFYTFMEEGPSVRNIKTIWFLSL